MKAMVYYDGGKKVTFEGTAKSLLRFVREIKRLYSVNRVRTL